jgi:membrane peptidoglycan carboxypeptidase
MTFVNGGSLLRPDNALHQQPADDTASFTLGAVPVAPMSMAAAYATVAARGMYCTPIAISKIVTGGGASLPVKSASCHRVFSTQIADAASYILQGVITSGTAAGRGINVPAAAKTGTSNGGYYAAFGGYTPRLAGYVSVFNPIDPTTPAGAMLGNNSCYRENPISGGGEACPGQMFGANAPGATWQMTFMAADLGPPAFFVPVPGDSLFFLMGDGVKSPKPPKPPKHHGGRGGGNVPPTPLPPLPVPTPTLGPLPPVVP